MTVDRKLPIQLALSWHTFLILLLVGFGLGTACFTLLFMLRSATSLPSWDHWAFYDDLARSNGTFTWQDWWKLHKEHRIVVPNLFLLADLRFAAGTNVILYCTSLVAVISSGIALMRAALRLGAATLGGALAILGFSLSFLASPLQMENFFWGFQVCFPLQTLFVLETCYWFSETLIQSDHKRVSEAQRSRAFGACLLFGLLASLTLVSGLAVWPALIGAALALRVGAKRTLILVFSAGLISILYFHNYPSLPTNENPLATVLDPVPLIRFFLFCIGAPWIDFGQTAAIVLGALGLTAIFPALWLTFNSSELKPIRVFSALVACIFLAAIGLVAASRVRLGYSARYQTLALCFWLALGLLLASCLERVRFARGISLVALLLVSVIPLLPVILGSAIVKQYRTRREKMRLIEVSMASRVGDAEALLWMHGNASVLGIPRAYLIRNRLSIFHDKFFQKFGDTIGSLVPNLKPLCSGEIEHMDPMLYPGQNGLRLTGRAVGPFDPSIARLAVTDGARRIVGFGRFIGGRKTHSWIAYASTANRPKMLQLFVILDGQFGCPIGNVQTVAAMPHLRFRQPG